MVRVRTGVYHDSVSLMRVSRTASALSGVEVAVVAMATELNLGIAAELGFDLPKAGPADLLIALRGGEADALEAALAQLDGLLAGLSTPPASGATVEHPRARSVPRPASAPPRWPWSRYPGRTRSPRRWTRSRPACL